MRKKLASGFIVLVLGLFLTGFGFVKKMTLSADTVSEGTVRTVSISLFIGVALIILSAILFVKASATDEKK